MSDEQGGSYHPGVIDIEAPSEIPSGTEGRFANAESLTSHPIALGVEIRLVA